MNAPASAKLSRQWGRGTLWSSPNSTDSVGSVTDLHAIVAELDAKGARLAYGGSVYNPGDPAGKMFFSILAAMAEFEADLTRARTREGVAIAKEQGRMTGRRPKLSALQHERLLEDYEGGKYGAAKLMELYGLSRSAMYAAVTRARQQRDANAAGTH